MSEVIHVACLLCSMNFTQPCDWLAILPNLLRQGIYYLPSHFITEFLWAVWWVWVHNLIYVHMCMHLWEEARSPALGIDPQDLSTCFYVLLSSSEYTSTCHHRWLINSHAHAPTHIHTRMLHRWLISTQAQATTPIHVPPHVVYSSA